MNHRCIKAIYQKAHQNSAALLATSSDPSHWSEDYRSSHPVGTPSVTCHVSTGGSRSSFPAASINSINIWRRSPAGHVPVSNETAANLRSFRVAVSISGNIGRPPRSNAFSPWRARFRPRPIKSDASNWVFPSIQSSVLLRSHYQNKIAYAVIYYFYQASRLAISTVQ